MRARARDTHELELNPPIRVFIGGVSFDYASRAGMSLRVISHISRQIFSVNTRARKRGAHLFHRERTYIRTRCFEIYLCIFMFNSHLICTTKYTFLCEETRLIRMIVMLRDKFYNYDTRGVHI